MVRQKSKAFHSEAQHDQVGSALDTVSDEPIDEENQLLIEMAQHDQVMGGSLDNEGR